MSDLALLAPLPRTRPAPSVELELELLNAVLLFRVDHAGVVVHVGDHPHHLHTIQPDTHTPA